LALDGEFCCGGVVLTDYAAWLGPRRGLHRPSFRRNCRSETYVCRPADGEGDTKRSAHAFSVGMGNAANAYPRLLKAAAGLSCPFRFFFRHSRRVLRELRTTPLRRNWADTRWREFRDTCTFAVHRDTRNLREMQSSAFPVSVDARWTACGMGQGAQYSYAERQVLRLAPRRHDTRLCFYNTRNGGYRRGDLGSPRQGGRGFDYQQPKPLSVASGLCGAGFLSAPPNYSSASPSRSLCDIRPNRALHITRGAGDGRMHL
jgi:hypothetical protein